MEETSPNLDVERPVDNTEDTISRNVDPPQQGPSIPFLNQRSSERVVISEFLQERYLRDLDADSAIQDSRSYHSDDSDNSENARDREIFFNALKKVKIPNHKKNTASSNSEIQSRQTDTTEDVIDEDPVDQNFKGYILIVKKLMEINTKLN